MEGSADEPSSLQSICHLRASELFPKHSHFETDDSSLSIPFTPLSGEFIVALGRTANGTLALSNYRLYLQLREACYNIPLGLIEQLEVKEIFFLQIGCKDARSVSCAFSTNEHCLEWFKRIHKAVYSRKSIEEIFAFAYYAWATEEGRDYPRLGKDNNSFVATFNSEVERLKFNLHGTWRITHINKDYQMCSSYPPEILVPSCISDEILEAAGKFRSFRRIPAVVWRNVNNGAVIARSSQPEVGWLGWRSPEDEQLLKALSDACSYDRGKSTMIDSPNNEYSDSSEDTPSIQTPTPKKVLIVDARSYTTAVANRARGGGCECPDYYSSCDIQFMNLPNIHSIRKSFHAIRQLCASNANQPNWLSLLEGTRWLQHMSDLLNAAVTVASAVEREGRPVLVHCTDGWDRTPQIVALAQILLDPYYRTMDGFQILCEREWLDFGHKFADRCGQIIGSDDPNERCPVFLQWLDCVHQLIVQFPCSFQMSSTYFVKLAQHTYSQLFGTFLCNTRHERISLRIKERTFSVWRFLNSNSFINHLYSPSKNQVLWPSCNVRDLVLWTEVYLGSMEMLLNKPDKQRVSLINNDPNDKDENHGQMTKTRSYGDLIHPQDHASYLYRRLSDPSISIEKKFDAIALENVSDKEAADVVGEVDVDAEEGESSSSGDEKVNGICESVKEVDLIHDNQQNNNNNNVNNIIHNNDHVNNHINNHNIINNRNNNNNNNINNNEIPNNPSVDSSTDTLIPCSEAGVISDGKNDTGQTSYSQDNVTFWVENNADQTECNHVNHDDSEPIDTSVPLISRTPSSICPASPIHQDLVIDNPDSLDDVDGLPVIHCDIQLRIQQIIVEHKVREEALRKELHATRLHLINKVCNNHNGENGDRIDDIGSLPDSVGSAGDHGESLPSDMSWEAVEEVGPAPTLWVPDHAVNRCMGCDTQFWLGRRKHHCRGCGKIFCADCSENSTPLPSEHLYNPVRVCGECFSRLHHHPSACQCKSLHKNKHVDNNDTNLDSINNSDITFINTKKFNSIQKDCNTTVTTTTTTTITAPTTNGETSLTINCQKNNR